MGGGICARVVSELQSTHAISKCQGTETFVRDSGTFYKVLDAEGTEIFFEIAGVDCISTVLVILKKMELAFFRHFLKRVRILT